MSTEQAAELIAVVRELLLYVSWLFYFAWAGLGWAIVARVFRASGVSQSLIVSRRIDRE